MKPNRPQLIADQAAELARALVLEHFQTIEQNAADGDTDSDKPVEAKVTLALVWKAGATAGKVKAKISYGTRRKDEAEGSFDVDTPPLVGLEVKP